MINKKSIGSLLIAGVMAVTANAGNEDRAGSAGAQQLLINPWARSSAWAGAGSATARGLESVFLNVSGLAFTDKTEVIFSRTNWLATSGININNIGLAQRLNETSVIALSVMAMDFGDIPITTVNNPEGTGANYSPQTLNLGVSFAKEFSNSIYGGMTVRALSESISNVRSGGVAFDAGIRYITGKTDQVKFGLALRNVGPPMSFTGDGLSYTITEEFLGIDRTINVEQRAAGFELPSLVNIGMSYDFKFGEEHMLTTAGNFTSNSFTKDQIQLGAEYTYNTGKAMFSARAGYSYENGIFSDEEITTAFTGLSAGASIEFQFGQSETTMALDYSYRTAPQFSGVHCIGVRINVK